MSNAIRWVIISILLIMALAGQRAAWIAMSVPHGLNDNVQIERWEVYCLLPAVILQCFILVSLLFLVVGVIMKVLIWLFKI